jgi:hypothetical protein
MFSRCLFKLLAVVGLWSAVSGAAQAQYLFYSDSFNFSGSWSSYNSLADAQSGSNAVGGGAWASQPFTIFADGTAANNIFQTAFYAIPGLPPFLGVYDPTPGTLQNTNVFFNDADKSANITQSGGTQGGTSRFDPTGALSNAASGGDWLSYAFNAKAAGIDFPNANGTPPYQSLSNPSSVSGAFSGIFQNTGAGGTGLFYAVDLTGSFGGEQGTHGSGLTPAFHAVQEGTTHGAWHRQVVQRFEGLRFHHGRGLRGVRRLRSFLRHRSPGVPNPASG